MFNVVSNYKFSIKSDSSMEEYDRMSADKKILFQIGKTSKQILIY